MALATVTGLDRQGYFIPCRHAGAFPAGAGYQAVDRLFASHLESFLDIITGLEQFRDDLKAIGHDTPAPGPRWNQDWFPRLDAAVLYAMVRTWKPSCIVEIGSGHSTRFMVRAIADGAEAFTVDIAGGRWTQAPQRYHARSLRVLREKYAALGDRAALDAVLEATGCRAWLG